MTLYLASQSPRRAALVKLLGIEKIEICAPHILEEMLPDSSPNENVMRLASLKARAVSEKLRLKSGIILGADTTVVIDNQMLEKPNSKSEARRMLQLLSGRTHTVVTGVRLVQNSTNQTETFAEETLVTFRTLSDAEIDAYIATGSPMDKAGAYGIQEDHGAVFVSRIVGDYYNVVGLPLCRVHQAITRLAPEIFALGK